MFAAGLVAETRGLLPGLREGAPRRGRWATSRSSPRWTDRDLEGAAADTVVATRRFVRRQRSWFRRDRRIVWLAATSSDVVDRARAAIGASVR